MQIFYLLKLEAVTSLLQPNLEYRHLQLNGAFLECNLSLQIAVKINKQLDYLITKIKEMVVPVGRSEAFFYSEACLFIFKKYITYYYLYIYSVI